MRFADGQVVDQGNRWLQPIANGSTGPNRERWPACRFLIVRWTVRDLGGMRPARNPGVKLGSFDLAIPFFRVGVHCLRELGWMLQQQTPPCAR